MARKVSDRGTSTLAWDRTALTGNIIQAEDFAAAEKIAEGNPSISALRSKSEMTPRCRAPYSAFSCCSSYPR